MPPDLNLNIQDSPALADELDQDIVFEEKRISTVVYRKVQGKEIVSRLLDVIKALTKRVDELERALAVPPASICTEETLNKIWNNKEDDVWNTV